MKKFVIYFFMIKREMFHGVPVNENMTPADIQVLEKEAKVFQLNSNLTVSEEIRAHISWIITRNLSGQFNFERPNGVAWVGQDGGIDHLSGLQQGSGYPRAAYLLLQGNEPTNFDVTEIPNPREHFAKD